MNSLWISDTEENKLLNSRISENINFINKSEKSLQKTDVCIIGAGIFGLTCAYYLSKLGYKVIVLEKNNIGEKTTGHTTAKITSQHGLFYDYLTKSYGQKFARDYLEINEHAIKNIKDIIDKEKIKCDFEYQNSYVYTTKKEDLKEIKNEVKAVENLGHNCEFVAKTGLPFEVKGAICFKNQAQFHPLKYLDGLCKAIIAKDNYIYTNTAVFDVKKDGEKYITFSKDLKVKSKHVVIATHYPFINFPGFYFLKMYQSTSYLIAVDTKKTLFNGMYIAATNPTFSFRTAKYKGKELLLIGGGEHKTGQPTSYQNSYGILEKEAKKYYPYCEILFQWNTKDCISLDKIPYIGSYSSTMPKMFVGTGFKKWGMTLSNVAANIIVDMICGKENKFSYLFNSSRLEPIKNSDEMKNMIVQSANSLFINKLKHTNMNFDKIADNSGSILEINHQKVGIYKDLNGKIYAVKPICTHLGCLLSWNDVDKTWDCPCHGSRFNFDGKNLYDPAFKDLEIYNLGN